MRQHISNITTHCSLHLDHYIDSLYDSFNRKLNIQTFINVGLSARLFYEAAFALARCS